MNHRIALSYAGDDSKFVEYTAGILGRYLGSESVFHYTTGSSRLGISQFLAFVNEAVSNPACAGQKFYLVCFTREMSGKCCIVRGQNTELCDREVSTVGVQPIVGLKTWQSITNARDVGGLILKTVEVPLPPHGLSPQKLKEWSIPFQRSVFGHAVISYSEVTDIDRSSAEQLAEFLLRDILGMSPQVHSCKNFTYEKDILRFYADLEKQLSASAFMDCPPDQRGRFTNMFNAGVPMVWPTIRCRTDHKQEQNPLLDQIGSARVGIQPLTKQARDVEPDLVMVTALGRYRQTGLHFAEAGPRDEIVQFPHPQVGILVCGGIAPGINAVIDGIVRRHEAYDRDSTVFGYRNGLHGLSQDPAHLQDYRVKLVSSGAGAMSTSEHVSRGGSMLGTFRLPRMDLDGEKTLNQVITNLGGLDVLYVIGGDGSMKAASLLLREIRRRKLPLSVVGIPKTMDNDILWVWQSFGFATAVEKAREVIDCLSTEVLSNPRIGVVQLFGSVSGFVVSHAVLSGQPGQCDAALIPESPFTIRKLAEKLKAKFAYKGGDVDPNRMPSGMIVMAETAIPQDADKYLKEARLTKEEKKALAAHLKEKNYLDGQTSDELRSAGLKLVVSGLKKELGKPGLFRQVRIFSNEPRHILRATHPSFSDIIFGQRLGGLAVDNAMAGYSDFMVSQWLTEYVLVPIRLVALGRKRIKKDGIFWKSVLAKTGQGELV